MGNVMERINVVVTNTDPADSDRVKIQTELMPDLGVDEIEVETQYCSVNYPDLLMTKGKYQLRPTPPFVLGSEAVGRVRRCGAMVSSVREGDAVLALTWHGAFASRLILSADQFEPRVHAMRDVVAHVTPSTLLRAPLSVIPEGLDFQKVVAMGFAYSAAYHALKDRGNLQEGERLLVLGAGGSLGRAAVQIGHLMGADVTAVMRGVYDDTAVGKWARTVIDYSSLLSPDRRKSELESFHVVFDPLGGIYTEAAVKVLTTGGRLLVIGFVAGLTSVPTNILLLRECQLVGAAWGSWASREPALHVNNLETLYEWLRAGKIDPRVGDIYRLDQAREALMKLERGGTRGKLLLKTS